MFGVYLDRSDLTGLLLTVYPNAHAVKPAKHMVCHYFLVFSKFGAQDVVTMPTRNTPTVARIDRRFLTLSAFFAKSSELKAEGVLSEDVSFWAPPHSGLVVTVCA
jgi:hypothetical protein